MAQNSKDAQKRTSRAERRAAEAAAMKAYRMREFTRFMLAG